MPLISTASGRHHPALRAGVGHYAEESPNNRRPRKEMTSRQRDWTRSTRAALPILAGLVVLLVSATVRAGGQPDSTLRVESNTSGGIEIDARGASIEATLLAIASQAGFEVLLDPAIARPAVNIAVPMARVEDVLRQIMRGRNYALVYDAGAASPSRVIVLPPPAVGKPSLPFRQRTRAGGRR